MKDNLKNLIGLIALAVLMIAAIPANAQQYDYQSLAYTNQIGASATEAGNSAAITLTKWGDVVLEISGSNSLPDAANLTVTLESSIDGTTWSTGTYKSFATPAGAAGFRMATNIAVDGIGYIRVTSVANACTNPVSTFAIRYATKPKRYGN
jgi:hypothetical protein